MIKQSRLWKEPKIVLNILLHPFVQDPLGILTNAHVYLCKTRGAIASYVVLIKRKDHQQIKDVFTFKKHRGKGYASKIIKSLLENKDDTYLLCSQNVKEFYAKLGFKETSKMPSKIKVLKALGSTLSILFFHGKVIGMLKKVDH